MTAMCCIGQRIAARHRYDSCYVEGHVSGPSYLKAVGRYRLSVDSCSPSPTAAQACSRRSGRRRHVWAGNPPFPIVVPAKPHMATVALILAIVTALTAAADAAGVLRREPPSPVPPV